MRILFSSGTRSRALFALTRNSMAIRRLMLIPVNFPLSAGGPGRGYVPGAAMTLRWAGQVADLRCGSRAACSTDVVVCIIP